MIWLITIEHAQNFVYVECEGTYHADDYINLLDEFAVHPDFSSGMNIIIDYRNVDGSSFGFDSVMKLARRAGKYEGMLGSGHSAAIVRPGISYGLMHMYLQCVNWIKSMDGLGVKRKRMVYEEPQAALAFVGLPPDYVLPTKIKCISA